MHRRRPESVCALISRCTGDSVFGLAPGCLGPTVCVPASLLVHMPKNLSYQAAATAPTVYVTVFTAFQQAAAGPGMHVMIHAGTGGVGLAAVQVAQALSCHVSSSAGSPAKRCQLRNIGLNTTSDTRCIAFTENIILATDGRGVDILLNSLTSPGEASQTAGGWVDNCSLPAICQPVIHCRHAGCQPLMHGA